MGIKKNLAMSRFVEWTNEIGSEDGKKLFLLKVANDGGVYNYCKNGGLPFGQVAAYLAFNKELDSECKRLLTYVSHQLAAETIDIADESNDAKLRVSARIKLASLYNRDDYGDTVKVDHQVTHGISDALRIISERRLSEKSMGDLPDLLGEARQVGE